MQHFALCLITLQFPLPFATLMCSSASAYLESSWCVSSCYKLQFTAVNEENYTVLICITLRSVKYRLIAFNSLKDQFDTSNASFPLYFTLSACVQKLSPNLTSTPRSSTYFDNSLKSRHELPNRDFSEVSIFSRNMNDKNYFCSAYRPRLSLGLLFGWQYALMIIY